MKSGVRTKSIYDVVVAVFAIAFAYIVCFPFAGYSQSASTLYGDANKFYKAKQFPQAADEYEKLIAQGYKNIEVYYNLGNCYFKLDSVGRCILNYERAKKISPRDEDILHNLQLAKLKAIDNIQPVPQLGIITMWNDFLSFNNSKEWGIFALIAVWISIILFAVSLLFIRRRIFNFFSILFLFVSFSCIALAIHQHAQEANSNAAIVMASSAFVKSAPDAGASDLFMIHEGTKIILLDRVGAWNKIRLDDGKVGWIAKESFEKI